jgi:hypothetical protein
MSTKKAYKKRQARSWRNPNGDVPPPRHDVMRAPVYMPKQEMPRRPGADDHYKFKSKGF